MKHLNDVDESIDRKQPFIMGIDEAGRGPVMGPLVYGCCFAPVSEMVNITKMKFNDSKKLTEQQRDQLFYKVCESNKILGFQVDVITPEILSEKMLLKKPISLNVISHESAMGLVRSVLSRGYNIQELYLDTVGTPSTYQDMLKRNFPEISKIVVSKKADSIYPIVSAASICAKVIRDHEITSKNFDDLNIIDQDDQLSTDFGSGYPSDPVTKVWLTKNRDKVFGYPSFIRFSWSTADNAMRGNCYGVEWIQDNLSTLINTSIMINNGGGGGGGGNDSNDSLVGQKRKRFTFFNDNSLENCINDF